MMFGFALSGLQEFLYDLSPQSQARTERAQAGGRDRDAARRLRIRSAILTLIPGLVAYELKRADGDAEVVYLGGGKLLASASKDSILRLQPMLIELSEWLAKSSGGKLGAHWVSAEAVDSLSDSVRVLNGALSGAKWRAGRTDRKWQRLVGQILEGVSSESLGDRDWEAEKGAEFAREDQWIGFQVGEGAWKIGPWRVKPVKDSPDIAFAGKAKADVQIAVPTYTPKKVNGETTPLYELAELDAEGNEKGGAYLALLKLDGDGIGKWMADALDKDTDCSNYKAASGKLTQFFGTDLQAFLKEKYPRIYLVYSGGDDLVATGHFMDVLRAARDVQLRFRKLGIQPTVSAGISFYTRQSPILKAIEAAEDELGLAKQAKDAISIAGCQLNWVKLTETLEEVKGLGEAIAGETLNRGALNLLRQLGEPWLPGTAEANRELRFRSIPQLHYMRSRRTGWKENDWPQAVRRLFDSLQADETDWPRAALVGTLAAWSTKKRTEDE